MSTATQLEFEKKLAYLNHDQCIHFIKNNGKDVVSMIEFYRSKNMFNNHVFIDDKGNFIYMFMCRVKNGIAGAQCGLLPDVTPEQSQNIAEKFVTAIFRMLAKTGTRHTINKNELIKYYWQQIHNYRVWLLKQVKN